MATDGTKDTFRDIKPGDVWVVNETLGEQYYVFIVGVEPYTIHAAPASIAGQPSGSSYERSRFGQAQAYDRPRFDERCVERVAVNARGQRDDY